MKPSNSLNYENLFRVIEAFADESIDLSAKVFFSVFTARDCLPTNEIVWLLKPRDYDVPVSNMQTERIVERLHRGRDGEN